MKKIKSILCICLIFVLLFSMTVPCFATQSDYDFLLNCGFSKEYLDSLTVEILSRMRNGIGNDILVSTEIETIYLSENTNDNMQSRGTISENSLELKISASKICKKDTTTITRVLVLVTWEWYDRKPAVRKEDAIAVNWNSDIFYFHADSFYSMDLYKYVEDEDWIIHDELSSPKELNQGGLGFFTKLYNDSAPLNLYVGGQAIFFLNPSEPIYDGKTHGTGINVNYVHDRSVLPMSITFTYKSYSIAIETSREAFDSLAKSCNVEFTR